jgi:hypothetical protein
MPQQNPFLTESRKTMIIPRWIQFPISGKIAIKALSGTLHLPHHILTCDDRLICYLYHRTDSTGTSNNISMQLTCLSSTAWHSPMLFVQIPHAELQLPLDPVPLIGE